jgi:hypothetical protein
LVLGLALLAAILLDAFVVRPRLPWLSQALGLKLDVILFGTPFSIPRFGVIFPFCSLLLAIAVLLIPRDSWRRFSAWKAAVRTWLRIVLWALSIPVVLIIFGFIYKLAKGHMPEWLTVIAESFGIGAKVFIFEHEFFPLEASVATLLGGVIGVALFLWVGVQNGLRPAKRV